VILPSIETPADLQSLSYRQLQELSDEIRDFIISNVTRTGGHLGSNLGVVELTIALHRVFDSPKDILLWDTGHQAYVHKLLTGRRYGFKNLRQRGGLSGYPNRSESQHDWIESSHASTALSYAHGLSVALQQRGELIGHGGQRHVVAVVGDGSLTGGMAYEALNNLGHSNQRVVIVLNDNGRSYAPTVSKLSASLTSLRLNRRYLTFRQRLRRLVPHLPRVGKAAYYGIDGFTSVVREMVAPHTFFETLGVRYVGPIDGHNIEALETAFRSAAEWEGPIVVHTLTQKGRGYEPAMSDDLKMHDYKLPAAHVANTSTTSFNEVFAESIVKVAAADDRIVALTAAMAGPTGLLEFQARYPDRFFDVGIAEQHAAEAHCRDVLDLLLSRVRSGQFGRGALEPARGLCLQECRDHGGRRPEPSWSARHRLVSRDSQHDDLRALHGRRDPRHARHGSFAFGPQRDSLSQDRLSALRRPRG
jgi:1-deoxy-D-xylulose-5-phosphate synthase